jgi:hypothetical protein
MSNCFQFLFVMTRGDFLGILPSLTQAIAQWSLVICKNTRSIKTMRSIG